ncbi:MAG TPA: hypothetical protein VFE12_13660, partial [Acetobacteraceae bacterium]|nr:hypothetical protein [Acetobacteraceae bacterium]
MQMRLHALDSSNPRRDGNAVAARPAQPFKTPPVASHQCLSARHRTGIAMNAVQSVTGQGILTLIVAAAVVMGSPGPSTMSVTAVGAAYGFRR